MQEPPWSFSSASGPRGSTTAPGIHCQQALSKINKGEYPTTGTLTSGYSVPPSFFPPALFFPPIGKLGQIFANTSCDFFYNILLLISMSIQNLKRIGSVVPI